MVPVPLMRLSLSRQTSQGSCPNTTCAPRRRGTGVKKGNGRRRPHGGCSSSGPRWNPRGGPEGLRLLLLLLPPAWLRLAPITEGVAPEPSTLPTATPRFCFGPGISGGKTGGGGKEGPKAAPHSRGPGEKSPALGPPAGIFPTRVQLKFPESRQKRSKPN